MKKITIIQTSLASVLALGMAISASAQAMRAPAAGTPEPDATQVAAGPGLVGTNYSELSFGYQRQEGSPSDLRDYELLSNGNVYRNSTVGADANFTYDYLDGSANGYSDHRDEAQLGMTGFLQETWGKPFITADAGMAWERAADVSRKSFAYTGIGGVEFQVLGNLALTPFIEYQAEPHLYNHGLPFANFPDHLLDYGVKATYRINQSWNASATADLDQHSASDWGLRGGLSYRF
jgi:opacity protein-like surface antigen